VTLVALGWERARANAASWQREGQGQTRAGPLSATGWREQEGASGANDPALEDAAGAAAETVAGGLEQFASAARDRSEAVEGVENHGKPGREGRQGA